MTEDIHADFEVIFILALTALVHLLYGLALLKGYQKADLSVVYPVSRVSGPLITSFVALGLFSEVLSAWGVLGIFSLCVGVLLIAAKEKLSDLLGRSEAWVGVRWGLFIGTIIASYSIIDAYAVKTLALPPVLVGWVSSLGGDRKSTRLNSSHVAISYAVFCLKQKTQSSRISNTSPGSCYDS